MITRGSDKEIAKIEAIPVGNPDPLEPRPWLSWGDCHIKDCETPILDMHWLENRPFSEWEDNGDVYVRLDEA